VALERHIMALERPGLSPRAVGKLLAVFASGGPWARKSTNAVIASDNVGSRVNSSYADSQSGFR
jgi:hypothetical protein